MLNAAETNPALPVPAGTGADNRNDEADADAFASALASKLTDAEAVRELAAQSLEKLAAAFPGVTISSRSQGSLSQFTDYYVKTGDDASINISPQLMADMADNEELFSSIKDMISTLFAAGERQSLVNAGGQNTQRSVTVDNAEVRYVEVQRTASGTQLSVSALTLQTQQTVNDALQQMLGSIRQSGASGTASSGSAGTAAQGFERFVLGSETWRLQSFVSSQSLDRLLGLGAGSAALNSGNLLNQGMLLTGQTVTASLEVTIEQWQAEGGGADLWSYMQIMGLTDPLVLDLGGDGINLRSAEDGVYFDIKGDGSPVRTAFIQGNDAFLYLDQNGNGVADDANELFGEHGGFQNGFAKLAQYDDNRDGVIDSRDAAYHELRLWRDLNGDGVNQLGESMTLAEAGVASISLRHDDNQALDAHGNVIGERSSFTRADGSTGLVADVWLRSL